MMACARRQEFGGINSNSNSSVEQQYYLSGITMGVGAAGASAGRALHEVREKPARAAIRPRMVAIFIVFSFCYFVLCAEKNLDFPEIRSGH